MKKKKISHADYIFNVEPVEEIEIEVDGESVKTVVFESANEGDIVKICTKDHDLGVSAEYVWLDSMYPEYNMVRQTLNSMKLNGQIVKCHILTIEIVGDEKNIFFDISDFFDSPVFEKVR